MKVSLILTRRWFYHAVSVFLQSVLLLVVAYTTFYYRIDNFQDRIMVAITCMLVVANVQSSVGEMIPKTSYFKMIDYFLLYSLNVIILVMVYHTYQAAHIAEEDARRINKQGQIFFVIAFLLFQIVFWAVALAEFLSEKNIEKLTIIKEAAELLATQKVL